MKGEGEREKGEGGIEGGVGRGICTEEYLRSGLVYPENGLPEFSKF